VNAPEKLNPSERIYIIVNGMTNSSHTSNYVLEPYLLLGYILNYIVAFD